MSHVVFDGLLGAQDADTVLDFAIAHQLDFKPSSVGKEGTEDANIRRSLRLEELGAVQQLIEDAVRVRVTGLASDLRLQPFEATGYETEIVAHGDGAFYKRHIDVFTGRDRDASEDRLLSIVLYLHRRPRSFSGGELRLFPDMRPPRAGETCVDIEPEHGRAVAFSSWAPHEVRPIACPSGRFADFRFAVNCWVLRQRR